VGLSGALTKRLGDESSPGGKTVYAFKMAKGMRKGIPTGSSSLNKGLSLSRSKLSCSGKAVEGSYLPPPIQREGNTKNEATRVATFSHKPAL